MEEIHTKMKPLNSIKGNSDGIPALFYENTSLEVALIFSSIQTSLHLVFGQQVSQIFNNIQKYKNKK